MTALADQIADRAGWGEALVGGLVLGAATSLSGLVVSVTGAASGDASLAFSNGVGGIAAQTVFLALADLGHRRANLEHAAAEPANLIQGVLLMTLLTLPLVGYAAPPITILGLHPITAVMIGMYVYGLRVTREVREAPMWRPVQTDETREDTPEDPEEAERSPVRPAIIFAGLALVLALSGWVIAQSAGVLIQRSGLSSSLVGALVTAVLTSLPELVTTLAAVRRGALQLAVGGVIGGNMFDTLFLAASDIAYRDGSLYHALGTEDLYWLATGLLMTAILLAGQIRRQRDGPAGIGFESVALLAVYGTAVTVQALSG
ncbi:Inner membrane protein YrbG [Jannaschia aquimarina]|uniref:YrbG_4 protein n=2 Tax=Jannaschia aquimarina TaxID=935700 RepID=A0A0D1EF82_9RHOB|nr:Inner membrane protein YrbG [Jannaschia aquimarina]SNT35056.1 cation:H+ antiporter [Jannaschia aquimarina]